MKNESPSMSRMVRNTKVIPRWRSQEGGLEIISCRSSECTSSSINVLLAIMFNFLIPTDSEPVRNNVLVLLSALDVCPARLLLLFLVQQYCPHSLRWTSDVRLRLPSGS